MKAVSAGGLLRRADSQQLGPQGERLRMGSARPGDTSGDMSLYVEGSVKQELGCHMDLSSNLCSASYYVSGLE